MPAFTTNVEFGYYVRNPKVVYGRPDSAEKMKYLDRLFKRHHSEGIIYNDLRELCIHVAKILSN